ncbi:HipA domain-containing protein [Herbaspirillum seropedicae]|uniref:HipA domain-containing protein n=1 Tax=Herbaspirillum seropedicae TaxID=964 RepID=UPI0028594623|nr:HipA domain-containing protein [Herbaspirillum seropedicae]MDR6397468.1 serine/threonine-protein kinase HipA [Herbaspirillum seropedicae]
MKTQKQQVRRNLLAMTDDELVAGIEYAPVDESFDLQYSRQWLDGAYGFPLSPHIPLHHHGVCSRIVRDHIENLLPEGCALKTEAARHQVSTSNIFALAMYLCREPAGAVGFSLDIKGALRPSDREPYSRRLSDDELSARIRSRDSVSFAWWNDRFYQQLAGVQDKIQVRFAHGRISLASGSLSSTHILKPHSLNPLTPHLVANEHYCMKLAKAIGISVAEVDLKRVPEPVLLVERFDRLHNYDTGHLLHSGWIDRVHVVDGCQALGKHRSRKYQFPDGHGGGHRSVPYGIGFQSLFELAPQFMVPAHGTTALVRWALFNMLVGNSDAHAKNISFFQHRLGIAPAPAYDLVSTRVYEVISEMAMAFGDALTPEEVSSKDLDKFAAEACIPVEELLEEIKAIAPVALEYAYDLAQSDIYTEEERALLLQIAAFVRAQSVHLLGVASTSRRTVRLRPVGEGGGVEREGLEGRGKLRPSERLLANRDELERILLAHNGMKPRLYGPSAEGQDTEETGIHLVIDATPSAALGDLGRIEVRVSKLIGAPVTVTTPATRAEADGELLSVKGKNI